MTYENEDWTAADVNERQLKAVLNSREKETVINDIDEAFGEEHPNSELRLISELKILLLADNGAGLTEAHRKRAFRSVYRLQLMIRQRHEAQPLIHPQKNPRA